MLESKLKGLEIQHYRSIKHLQLSDIGKINLYVGKNGIGKTSILEALWLITGMTNVVNMPRIEGITRNFTYNNDDLFSIPFYERNISLCPQFSTSIDGNRRTLHIKPVFNKSELLQKAQKKEDPDPKTSFNNNEIQGLEFVFTEGDDVSGSSKIILTSSSSLPAKNQSNMQVFMSHKHSDKYSCTFIFQNDLNPAVLNDIFRNNAEQPLTELLQKIDPTIKSLALIDNLLYVDMGFQKRMPINVLGDGIKKITHIFLCLFAQKNNFIAIDAIENGLTICNKQLLWKVIAEGSYHNNVDIFITSQSKSLLTALVTFLRKKENTLYRDLFRIHHLHKTNENNILKTHVYSHDDLNDVLKQDFLF